MTAEVFDGVTWQVLVDETDLAALTYYYPAEAGLGMKGFDDLSIRYILSGGVTMTIEVEQEASDEAAPTWLDITPAGFDLTTNATGAVSFVDLAGIVDFDNLNVMKFRIKIVTSDATNAVYVSIRQKSRDR